MRNSGVVVVLLLVHLCGAAATGREQCGVAEGKLRSRRIINGDGVRVHQYPWVVSIQIDGSHLCGGAVISADYVLSAAHCFVNPDFHHATVVAGLHDLSSEGIRVNGKVTVHPGYRDGDKDSRVNDVALIHLHRPLTFDEKVQPICLPAANDSLQIGEDTFIAGWGRELTMFDLAAPISQNLSLPAAAKRHMLKAASSRIPAGQSLKQSKLLTENAEKCLLESDQYVVKVNELCKKRELNALWCSLNHHHPSSDAAEVHASERTETEPFQRGLICTISPDRNGERSSVCYGDSGGPLMRQLASGSWSLVGVTSAVPFDCIMQVRSLPQIGGMFVDVRHQLDWIRAVMERRAPSTVHDAIPAETPSDDFVNSRGGAIGTKEHHAPRSSSGEVTYAALLSWDFFETADTDGVRLKVKLSGH